MLIRALNSPNSRIFVSLFICVLIVILFQIKILYLEENQRELVRRIENLVHSSSVKSSELIASHTEQRNSNYSERDLLVIYNRVPKTGSTSFVNVAYDLCKLNRFNVLHLNVSANQHVMSLADQGRFVRNLTQWNVKKPGLYHGHVSFIDFEKFGAPQPVYINILRRPLDRLVSYYYFLRFGDNYRPHLIRSRHGDKMTFDECVVKRLDDCNPDNMWLQIPFLCGHAAECWVHGSEWALERAKRNLIDRYLLVGVTEQLDDFIAVLESSLPSMFRGALHHFQSSNRSHLRRTNQKVEPSEVTVAAVKRSRVWQMENELYEFAREQFQFARRRMGVAGDGSLFDRGRQFMFEKISPK